MYIYIYLFKFSIDITLNPTDSFQLKLFRIYS